MTPDRLKDARRLLGKLPTEDWIDTYAADLLDLAERQLPTTEARATIAAHAAAGARLGNECAKALSEFETSLGGGDRKMGLKLLQERSGTLQPTRQRLAAAIRFYAAIRLSVLRWTGSTPDLSQYRATGAGDRLAGLVDGLVKGVSESAAPEQKARLQELAETFKGSLFRLGILSPEGQASEPGPDPEALPVDPEAN